MAKKKETPAPKVGKQKKHERVAKPAEIDLIEKGKRLAASYLEQRDGMDPQLALDIVESMGADDINALIEEANTAVIDKTKAAVGAIVDTILEAQGEPEFVSFLQTPLVNDEEFAGMMVECRAAGKLKLQAEKEYKRLKAELYTKMTAAKSPLVECLGVKMEAYTGYAVFLDEQLLLEAGVAPELIKKGWKRTPYNDVRMTAPKEAKA